MTDKIVQLVDKDNNNLFPVAGSIDPSALVEVVGTVTGANRNYCLKYADGTMIACIKKGFTNQNINSAWGSLYSKDITGTSIGYYAVPFVEAPVVSVTANPVGDSSLIVATFGSYDKTHPYGLTFTRPVAATGLNIWVHVIAIGRWK